jgi:hypothetical protein
MAMRWRGENGSSTPLQIVILFHGVRIIVEDGEIRFAHSLANDNPYALNGDGFLFIVRVREISPQVQ